MKIVDKTNEEILSHKDLNIKFTSNSHKKFKLDCNVLNGDFYSDTHNFYPITNEHNTFLEMFKWGDLNKYNNFYSSNFLNNFNKNKSNFKSFSDLYILGSSSSDNYYRNILTFLPRLFFINNTRYQTSYTTKIKLAIHRNSSNKFRDFLKELCTQMNIEIQFIYLDEGFYNFKNSQIPQFFSKKNSIRILSSLGIKSQSRKEKIYISRRNSSVRNLINEDDIIIKLKKFGFRIIDLNDFNIFQQIELFSNADIIVSATGSGLTNIVFCNHNATVVEIIPKYRHHYEDIFKERYKYIAKKLNLKYFSLIADPISIESFSKKYTDKILPNVLEQSNYYKNLLLKLEKLDNFIKN